jgi:cytochrome b involved in lipid metabolism
MSGDALLNLLLVEMQTLRLPPRWWVEEEQAPYSAQLLRWRDAYSEGDAQWKLFYFLFGQHWSKWAVGGHCTEEDCWVVIHGTVFDVTHFDDHPGRMEPFLRYAGTVY